MKAGTLEHMKFAVLKAKLQVTKYQAIGILEGLWYLTSTCAKDGDIGRFSNLEIAAWLEWEGDPDQLIQALIVSRFLDATEEPTKDGTKQRLVVHDWAEHAPNWVKGNLRRHGKGFSEQPAKEATKEPAKKPTKQATKEPAKDATTKSSLVKSSLETPTPPLPPAGDPSAQLPLDDDDAEDDDPEGPPRDSPPPDGLNIEAWDRYVAYRRQAKFKALKPASVEKQQLWLVAQGPPDIQAQIIENSIRNSWQGLFELKGERHGAHQQDTRTRAERHHDKLREIAERSLSEERQKGAA